MGAYDFTYCIPINFNNRVIQFLNQSGRIRAAQAFLRCKYEYEDLGLAYYAGMRGDNWDKHALEFTFEGSEADIAVLRACSSVLENAIGKALKSSESGFLVKKVYYLISDDVSESRMIPLSNEERLNADMSTAKAVLDDLLQLGEHVCRNVSYDETSSENSINDFFRDMLSFKGYNEVKDQTRHGIAPGGKDAGEVDILLTKDGHEIAIFEGLKLSCVDKDYIDKHISKSIVNYNALGTATFVVAYVNSADFGAFWERYSAYVQRYNFPLQIKKPFNVLPHPNAAARVATAILLRDGYDFLVYFIAFKMS